MTNLADRHAVHRTLSVTFSWASVNPELFDELFDSWFSGRDLAAALDHEHNSLRAATFDADVADTQKLHVHDTMPIEVHDERDEPHQPNTTGDHRSQRPSATQSSPAADDAQPVPARGSLALVPPRDDVDGDAMAGKGVVELPNEPVAAELELAREALAGALHHRHGHADTTARRRVKALAEPLSNEERRQLVRTVRQLDRRLDGAPSWRRTHAHTGAVDLRRTLRRAVTTAGLPIDLRHTNQRTNAARLVVLVDLSMSVRGTARLVLHLVHRMRSMLGSMRAFGYVDSCAPIDAALRTGDPGPAIERVLGLVDIDASSDPGRSFRQWWTRWHHLVSPDTHVIILGDGRCNGRDPELATIERITQRSASTSWVSPEPPGAWSLGRGEMADYAQRVDRAVTIRTIDDLDRLVPPHRTRPLMPARPA